MFPAARVTDNIVSTATQGAPVPIIPPGTPTVLIGGMAAATLGDSCGADTIVKGSATVLIGGKPAARVTDSTAGGGIVMPPGEPTVLDRRVTWPTRPLPATTARSSGAAGRSRRPSTASVGGVQMLEHEADIVSSLHILLSTARGERIMVPQYGCNMDELVFENLDTRMRTLMADKIESAILYHEPRIDLERVQLDDDPNATLEGRVLIGVTYRVKATNSRFNFVFPYYRDEGTDINLTTTVQLLPDEP